MDSLCGKGGTVPPYNPYPDSFAGVFRKGVMYGTKTTGEQQQGSKEDPFRKKVCFDSLVWYHTTIP
jgi:hypothetical protein